MNNAKKHLQPIFDAAIEQAASGKGNERHGFDKEFMDQQWVKFTERFGLGFLLGQANKKADEAMNLDTEAARKELLGAINYLAMAYLSLNKECEHEWEKCDGNRFGDFYCKKCEVVRKLINN